MASDSHLLSLQYGYEALILFDNNLSGTIRTMHMSTGAPHTTQVKGTVLHDFLL